MKTDGNAKRQPWRRGAGLATCIGVVLAMLVVSAPALLLAQNWPDLAAGRLRMVQREIVAAGVTNPRVIEAMQTVPRHEFVPLALRAQAYYDMALPIGHGQTISPPFIVAYMTEQLDPKPTDRVLEIGTGSGYQAAVLSELVKEVYTIEIVEPLGHHAAKDLKRLKYANVSTKVGDGYQGWAEHAPFDKIIVTCSPEKVPKPLVDQLKEGGRIVVPVGQRYQQSLYLLKKVDGKMETEALRPVLFVPMTGEAERTRQVLPDRKHPTVINGDFETLEENRPEELAGWHYQRQLEIKSEEAPSGKRYVQFTNIDAGRGAQALQGFAVDGRYVKQLHLSAWVRAEGIRAGQNQNELPAIVVTFMDENRANISEGKLGPWRGTFAWQKVSGTISVPGRSREAILRIGLLGAVGSISFDLVKVEAADKEPGR